MIRQTLGIKAGNNGDVRDGGSKHFLQESKGRSETKWFDVGRTGKKDTKFENKKRGNGIRVRETERRRKRENDR